MFEYRMDHVCSYTASLVTPPEVIGPLPEGIRLNVYVKGGEVTGPRISGIIRPVGADWLTIRTDGVAILDVRATMETGDGALIYLTYTGIVDLGTDGHARFLRGDLPATAEIRAVPRLHCAHPDYAWVNRLQYVNIGRVNFETFTVGYDLYALR